MIDILFINPGDRKKVFQDLGDDATAIEPPYLTLSYASYLNKKGCSVDILDVNALNLSIEEVIDYIKNKNPKLIALVVYGNQPSASTQNMTITENIANRIKEKLNNKIVVLGLHPSALPRQTLESGFFDYVIEGEGPVSLEKLISYQYNKISIEDVDGLWYYRNDIIYSNKRASLIKNLDEYMPIANWELLPMDKYRAHNWHCFTTNNIRKPYAAIYTSLGCPYSCEFCCINAPFGKSGIRYRSPELVVAELELLNLKYGVKNIKIIDEMFVLHEQHYMKIVDLIIEKELDLNIWCYARVDTIKEENLKRMKKAGINWLALGIESANPNVRDGAQKKLRVDDIKSIIDLIRKNNINIIGNFIFGLPEDTSESMRETLDMAKELKCEFVNFYCAMAYPGSRLYNIAVKEGWMLPESWIGYSQHSYEMLPLRSKYLSAREIVKFRDEAFDEYFKNEEYLTMIENKFGHDVRINLENICKKKLKRKILEENL
ncbi:radical SAM protein [Campylobacter lari]|uniref:B12-binding domain-containing radical SAM protein n=1 Tax=Campylobacter lari TaxID=201 RepID=UPI001827E1BA|nr:radical SAM protein [Campylobacter lari]EGK8059045.1 radical SAM protein [Campylobacter lari]